MRIIERILDQLNRTYGGEAWHGDALREIVQGITESEARARPIANAHTILELVVHITAWIEIPLRRLAGEVVEGTPSEDWRNVEGFSFADAVSRLEKAHSALIDVVARMSPERLDDIVPGKPYSVYVMLEGIMHHYTYHGGQIALLKKMR